MLTCIISSGLLVFLSLFVIKTTASPVPEDCLFRLDIVHYNDFHARFEETSVKYPTCIKNDSSCLGGFARLYTTVTELLEEKPNALLLNAGDDFQGTAWYTLFKWNITQKFMNLLPHDAHAIGNHEFDDGPAGLVPYLEHLNSPVVAANMDTSEEPSLDNLYKKSIVVERNGHKIGIIGLITRDTVNTSSPGKVKFTDEREAACREAANLKAQGIEIIIVLSHCGLDVDKEIAANYGENINIIVGGHSHSLLYNGPAPSGENVEGPYPVIVHNSETSDHKVVIVQASAFTKYVGNLSVYFDKSGEYRSWEGSVVFLNRSIPEDEGIKSLLAPYAKELHDAANTVIGSAEIDLDFDACVFGECNTGDVICDAFIDKVNTSIKTSLPIVAIIARGNIRAGIPKGNITRGQIYDVLPYSDGLKTFELQGLYIKQALEHGYGEAWAYHPFKGPDVLQIGGMRATINVTRPEGDRVVSVEVMEGDYKPLDNLRIYQVTTGSFLANGGDGFDMVRNNLQNVRTLGYDTLVVEDYITKISPITQKTDGRITILEQSSSN